MNKDCPTKDKTKGPVKAVGDLTFFGVAMVTAGFGVPKKVIPRPMGPNLLDYVVPVLNRYEALNSLEEYNQQKTVKGT